MKLPNLSTKQKIAIGLVIFFVVAWMTSPPVPKVTLHVPRAEDETGKEFKKFEERLAADFVLAGSSRDNWSSIYSAVVNGDKATIDSLIKGGKAFEIEKGTRLAFISSGFASNIFEVMVQEGEHNGRTVFMPRPYFTGEPFE